MFEGDAVYFTTGPASHKARRIARGSPLLVWIGAPDGPHFVGQVTSPWPVSRTHTVVGRDCPSA